MRTLVLTFLSAVAAVATADAQTNIGRLGTSQGELIQSPFASAPFPHSRRAEGYRYREEFLSAKDHYSDSTVAIFIPKGFRETGRIDLVIHFHGWRNHVAKVLPRYELIQQLVDSRRNAVLVVPQGPYDAPDSFGGKLEDPGGFKRFLAELSDTLRRDSGLTNKNFQFGHIILSAHSGGYQVVSAILDHGGQTSPVKEAWLFDALYARTDRFLAWSGTGRRFIDIYTEHGGTKQETEQLMSTLKSRGVPFLMQNEPQITPAALRTNNFVFIYTGLEHDDVVHKHHTFRKFLETSCLEPISAQ